MKKKTLMSVINSLFMIALLGFVIVSCNSDDPVVEDQSATMESIAFSQAEIDNVSEGVNDIIENVFFDFENKAKSKNEVSKTSSVFKFLPDCVEITKVMTGTSKSIIIDYGDGCTMHNENILSGKIIMDITFNIGELKTIIKSTFNNLYFNGKKVEGNMIKNHTISGGTPVATINTDIKILWEDGNFATVKGERKRAWIEGYGNLGFGDNVFLVSGNWIITKKDGTVRNVSIVEPLRREMSCRYIVSGTVKFEHGDQEITVDYGDGECDDLATALINNGEFEFHIGRSHFRQF